MWVSYRAEENSGWDAAERKHFEKDVKDTVKHYVPLAVDIPPTDPDANFSDAAYQGEFVIDIDHKPESDDPTQEDMDFALQQSIDSAQKVVQFLVDKGCNQHLIQIYCSGGKGFHLHIPQGVLTLAKSKIKRLNEIYRNLAKDIANQTGATGFDYGLYAGQRGHMIRVPGSRRPDGKWKARIFLNELEDMTPEKYRSIVTIDPSTRKFEKSPGAICPPDLSVLFNNAKELMDLTTTKRKMNLVPEDFLHDFLVNDINPKCVDYLSKGKNLKAGKNFNEQMLQLAIYIQAVGLPEYRQEAIADAVAANYNSKGNASARRNHLLNSVLKSVSEYQFSCAGMKSCVDMSNNQCMGCPVVQKTYEQASATTGIYEKDGSTWITGTGDDPDRRLFDVIVNIDSALMPENHKGASSGAWAAVTLGVYRDEILQAELHITPSDTRDIKTFRIKLITIGGISLDLKEGDQIRLFEYLWKKPDRGEIVRQVLSAGIQKVPVVTDDGKFIEDRVWVEPGWSWSSTSMVTDIEIHKDVPNVIRHSRTELRQFDPEMTSHFIQTLRCSDAKVVAIILGWSVATNLRPLLMETRREFPLLHLVGVMGAGKTALAKILTTFGGANYYDRSPPTASGLSASPIREMTYECTSIPRVLDEASSSKVSRQLWSKVLEYLKATYQQSQIAIGTMSTKSGKRLPGEVRMDACSPMMYISTSMVAESELRDRSIELFIDERLKNDPNYYENFEFIYNSEEVKESLFRIHKMIVRDVLLLDLKEIDDVYASQLNKLPRESFQVRERKAYAYVLTGLEYLKSVIKKYSAPSEAIQMVSRLQDAAHEWINQQAKDTQVHRSRTEFDEFMGMVLQGTADVGSNGAPVIQAGNHYHRKGNTLYINLDAVFPAYLRQCRAMSKYTDFMFKHQLEAAIHNKRAYIGTEIIPNPLGNTYTWHKFDIALLKETGNDFTGFADTL